MLDPLSLSPIKTQSGMWLPLRLEVILQILLLSRLKVFPWRSFASFAFNELIGLSRKCAFDGNAADVHFILEFLDRRPAVMPGKPRAVSSAGENFLRED